MSCIVFVLVFNSSLVDTVSYYFKNLTVNIPVKVPLTFNYMILRIFKLSYLLIVHIILSEFLV